MYLEVSCGDEEAHCEKNKEKTKCMEWTQETPKKNNSEIAHGIENYLP